jgi:hypothetical protein
MARGLSFLTDPRHGSALMMGGAFFVCGLFAGAALSHSLTSRAAAPAEAVLTAASPVEPMAQSAVGSLAHRLDPRIVYPADVLRVIDGDTFQARVRV